MLERLSAGDERRGGLAAVLVQPFGQPRQAAVANLDRLNNKNIFSVLSQTRQLMLKSKL